MKRTGRPNHLWLIPAAALPGCLILLFYLLKGQSGFVDGWVFGALWPLSRLLGKIWSVVPFSVGEVLVVLALLALAGGLIWSLVQGVRRRTSRYLLRLAVAVGCIGLWLFAGLCWMWNITYYAQTFSQRSGLALEPYSVAQLRRTTAYFAMEAARLSVQMPRDEDGFFSDDQSSFFDRATGVYDELVKEFSFLDMKAVRAKPIFFSRVQSVLGFTGMYFPYTGEANVNVDAPGFLCPVTIAHEMAHQRMIASELEANFVAIAACVSSEDDIFAYSGYMLGLIQLCNALYPEDPEGWNEIVETYFTPEMLTDWRENNDYWRGLSSDVEQTAAKAYDAFLKGNGQELGIRSYGACVDLLVIYFADAAQEP